MDAQAELRKAQQLTIRARYWALEKNSAARLHAANALAALRRAEAARREAVAWEDFMDEMETWEPDTSMSIYA